MHLVDNHIIVHDNLAQCATKVMLLTQHIFSRLCAGLFGIRHTLGFFGINHIYYSFVVRYVVRIIYGLRIDFLLTFSFSFYFLPLDYYGSLLLQLRDMY